MFCLSILKFIVYFSTLESLKVRSSDPIFQMSMSDESGNIPRCNKYTSTSEEDNITKSDSEKNLPKGINIPKVKNKAFKKKRNADRKFYGEKSQTDSTDLTDSTDSASGLKNKKKQAKRLAKKRKEIKSSNDNQPQRGRHHCKTDRTLKMIEKPTTYNSIDTEGIFSMDEDIK